MCSVVLHSCARSLRAKTSQLGDFMTWRKMWSHQSEVRVIKASKLPQEVLGCAWTGKGSKRSHCACHSIPMNQVCSQIPSVHCLARTCVTFIFWSSVTGCYFYFAHTILKVDEETEGRPNHSLQLPCEGKRRGRHWFLLSGNQQQDPKQ